MISQTTEDFWDCYEALPQNVQEGARRAYAMWQLNHYRPSSHFKTIKDTTPALYSVRIGLGYRALGYLNKDGKNQLSPGFGWAPMRSTINSSTVCKTKVCAR